MKAPNELKELAYNLSKMVFEKKIKGTEAKQQLANKGVKDSTAAGYINNFRCMLNGLVIKRRFSSSFMEYFLINIYKDFGSIGLSSALEALRQHIEYLKRTYPSTPHNMIGIHAKYSSFLIETPDELEQNEIILELKTKKKSKNEIIEDLKNLSYTDPEVVIINSKSFKRDNKTIAQIKFVRDFKCQICSTRIRKKDGTFYIEAAHIDPKREKGCETPDNIILLCPNHHKEFDLGDRVNLSRNKEEIHFRLNDEEYIVSLKLE